MPVLLLIFLFIMNFQPDPSFDPGELTVITLDNVSQIDQITTIDSDLRLYP